MRPRYPMLAGVLVALVSLLLLTAAAGAAGRSIRLVIDNNRATVDGQEQVLDVPPLIVNNRTLVPLRFVAEALGLTVDWAADTRTITLTGGSTGAIRLQIDNAMAQVGGTAVTLDAAPAILGGRTLVPLRFVAESLGLTVAWDGATRAIAISAGGAAPGQPQTPPPSATTAPVATTPSAPTAPTVTVNMAENRFVPATLTIPAGTTVIWTNGDREDHAILARGGEFESPNLPPGASFRRTFDTPGTYAYFCDLHVDMDGTVIVPAQ